MPIAPLLSAPAPLFPLLIAVITSIQFPLSLWTLLVATFGPLFHLCHRCLLITLKDAQWCMLESENHEVAHFHMNIKVKSK